MASPLARICLISAILTLVSGASIIKNNAFPLMAGPEPLDPEGKLYFLSWEVNVQENLITFAVEAATLGFVGFGISPEGSMTGADIFIAGVFENGTTYSHDMHAVDNARPIEDAHTDWGLLNAWENGNKTNLEFYRKLSTCDDEDYPILTGRTRLIWAIGETDNIEYHKNTRGGKSVDLVTEDISGDPCTLTTRD